MNRRRLLELGRGDLRELLERTVEVAPLDPRRKVFVNRNLRLDKIEVIGFDLDYTIAIYKKLKIEELAFRATVEKLVSEKGYPEAIRGVRYEPDRVIRGLVCDKRRGNIIKMDRHGHVGRVFHGSREIPKEERIRLYRTRKMELDPSGYAFVDTLFGLPEACLYSQLVEFFDALGGESRRPSYRTLYQDIRESIDKAHADGTIKSVIRAAPSEYIERDEELAQTLHRFRSSGKRLFLLTNSHWDYTDVLLKYLLDNRLEGYPSWRNYFDIVIVAAQKPAFFVRRTPFSRLQEPTSPPEEAVVSFEKGKVYCGGNLRDLERIGRFGGERVLYIGDHIYGDILRSKKSSLWRTAMIVPELEDVISHEEREAADIARFAALEDEMQRLDYEINYYKLLLSSLARLRDSRREAPESQENVAIARATRGARDALDRLKAKLRTMVAEHRDVETHLDRGANPYWGRLFVEGSEASRFGKQVEDYACLYTSRVSNFLYYSPTQYFRSPPRLMPHERAR